MHSQMTIGALVVAACSSMSLAGAVVDLQPGDFVPDLGGVTNSDMSELIGSIEFDYMQDFTIFGDNSEPVYGASLLTRVVRSNQTGDLTLNFQIQNPVGGMGSQVSHIEINGFSGLQTRVEYRGEAGFGDVGPSIAARSPDGDIITFDFNSSLASDQTSKFFFVMIGESEYDFDGIQPTATVWTQSGDSVTLNISPPIPAPGALALLGAGGLCFARRRR